MSSVHRLRWQVLRERLSGRAATAVRACDEETARLALCCLTLLDEHEVDGKGRCRRCRAPQMWWPRARHCSVVRTVGFHLLQPARLLPWRSMAADVTAGAIRLPRAGGPPRSDDREKPDPQMQ